MQKPLWSFTDDAGTFVSETAHHLKTLYFPLCNSILKSAVSPELRGTLAQDYHHFLLEPSTRQSLFDTRSSRNFWIYINPTTIWSATGVSRSSALSAHDKTTLTAGLLWHTVTRINKKIGLQARITSFIPSHDHPVEIMHIEIKNISRKKIRFTPTAAIPLYARSAANIRDHRHVTSLLNRIVINDKGIIVTPTLSFDESGHHVNTCSYFVYGFDPVSHGPTHLYPTRDHFIGDDSDVEAPAAVYMNRHPDTSLPTQGKEAMGGLRFKPISVSPGQTVSYHIILGIAAHRDDIPSIVHAYNTGKKIEASFEETKKHWQAASASVTVTTGYRPYDSWLKWVTVQPVLRKIFGNSFLPDFDYGKGGRGWRDLWQDCLALILTGREEVRLLIVQNYAGVRIDGSNAAIIGSQPGEFIADRNNISRVWMDHGAWPLMTVLFYIHQTGDKTILFEEAPYFKDQHLSRCRKIDRLWSAETGTTLKTKNNDVYKGTILEHILIQHCVPFFNVGIHNHFRLENADWNDGLDMAYENGESVSFSALYASNFKNLAALLKQRGVQKVSLLRETVLLLDTISQHPVDYSDSKQKQTLLHTYFNRINSGISGEKVEISTAALIKDLSRKADWLTDHIRSTEWLDEGFYNGYYNNDQQRVEGIIKGLVRMTLTGQVFPVLSGIATHEQVRSICTTVRKYLKDTQLGGYRLNTDFKEEQHNLGRAFSFVYGDKENGAFFNHMAILFAYALYSRGYVLEGYDVFSSIYAMAADTAVSKIYPGIPEYFNGEGRGMYSYLTGSASWYLLTLITQICGVRGEYGDLVIEPKLAKAQFRHSPIITLNTSFSGSPIRINFKNQHKKEYGAYSISTVLINGIPVPHEKNIPRYTLSQLHFKEIEGKPPVTFDIILD